MYLLKVKIVNCKESPLEETNTDR